MHMQNNPPTFHEDKLFNALKKEGINCEQHHKDYYNKDGVMRYKTVDIYLPDEQIFIEVDGLPHITEPRIIISDFNRDYFSHKKGFFTKHITNEAIDTHLDEIVQAIVEIIKNVPNKIGERLLIPEEPAKPVQQ
jgi:very-short-patch-repair endonuclease